MRTPEGAIAQVVIKNTNLQTHPVLSGKGNDNFNIYLFLLFVTPCIPMFIILNLSQLSISKKCDLTWEPADWALGGYEPLPYSHPPCY